MAQRLAVNRAQAVTEESAREFHDLVKRKEAELALKFPGGIFPASNKWNADDTSFSGSQRDKTTICKRDKFSFY